MHARALGLCLGDELQRIGLVRVRVRVRVRARARARARARVRARLGWYKLVHGYGCQGLYGHGYCT